MNDFFKISIAEAFDEYELHCKARNLSKNTLKRHLEDYKYFDKYYDTYNMCSTKRNRNNNISFFEFFRINACFLFIAFRT